MLNHSFIWQNLRGPTILRGVIISKVGPKGAML